MNLPEGWHPVRASEQELLQRRYDLEMSRGDFRTGGRVTARDAASDDVLVELPDGALAIVHLTWSDDDRCLPHLALFQSPGEALAAMRRDTAAG